VAIQGDCRSTDFAFNDKRRGFGHGVETDVAALREFLFGSVAPGHLRSTLAREVSIASAYRLTSSFDQSEAFMERIGGGYQLAPIYLVGGVPLAAISWFG